QSGDEPLSIQAGGSGSRMDRSRQRKEAGDLHDSACGQVHLPRTGRDQQWRLERAWSGVTYRDLAPMVGYIVVQARFCCVDIGFDMATLSGAHSSDEAAIPGPA